MSASVYWTENHEHYRPSSERGDTRAESSLPVKVSPELQPSSRLSVIMAPTLLPGEDCKDAAPDRVA